VNRDSGIDVRSCRGLAGKLRALTNRTHFGRSEQKPGVSASHVEDLGFLLPDMPKDEASPGLLRDLN
jgi:hypothetical protein